jgi:hypothetical protein
MMCRTSFNKAVQAFYIELQGEMKKVFCTLLIFGSALICISMLSCTMVSRQKPESKIVDPGLTICPEIRPEVCTMDYQPVCAQLRDSGFKPYSNGCTACSDQNVTAYSDGACEK